MAAAGSWHNLLAWTLLMGLASTNLGDWFYRDVSNLGRVVLDVDPVSLPVHGVARPRSTWTR